MGSSDVTYNILASSCNAAHEWARALATFEELRIKAVEPDVKTYNTALSALQRGQHWTSVLHMFQCMRASSITPTETSYTTTVSACMKASKTMLAKELLREM